MHADLHPDWSATAVCDSHLHLYSGKSFAWNLQSVRGYMRWFGVERAALLALPEHSGADGRDEASNLRCLGVKAVLDAEDPARRVYALAGLVPRRGPGPDTPETFAAQARRALAMGYDGFKSLLGKPGLRKRDGTALDDPVFDAFYGVLEETGRPLVLHVGDPADFWDLENPPLTAKANGWLYDGSFPPLAQLRAEAENVLRKHPALHATFAHVFFLGEEPDEAERLLSAYPNLGFDLAPGWEMHAGFTRFHDRWHDLFERFRDRFYFATDTANWHASAEPESYGRNYHWAYDMVRDAVELQGRMFVVDCDDVLHRFRSLDLSPEAREAVCRGNFLRRFGAEPAPVDRAAALEDVRALLARYEAGPPPGTAAEAAAASLPVLRRWAASPDALFRPEAL